MNIKTSYSATSFVQNTETMAMAVLEKRARNIGKDLKYSLTRIIDNVEVTVRGATPMEVFILMADVKLALDCGDCLEDNSDYTVKLTNLSNDRFDFAAEIFGTGVQVR